MAETLLLIMLFAIFLVLLMGYPVAFVLGGVSLLFALIGHGLDVFDLTLLQALPSRIFGIMYNELLLAVPLFVFMGVTLERAKIAESLLETMTALCGSLKGGLGISVLLVGALLAASTGIVGATVVTMGLIALPSMLKAGYCKRVATGIITSSGTLGQIIPPSIVLILLGDQMSGAWQITQMRYHILATSPVTIADLFVAALAPGLGLVFCYFLWLMAVARFSPQSMPDMPEETRKNLLRERSFMQIAGVIFPPLMLIALVLGSILLGVATATESASIGALGAIVLAWRKKALTRENLCDIARSSTKITCMVFTILIGATVFTLIFRGFGGEDIIHHHLSNLPGGLYGAIFITMLAMFLLGFFLDFIEITFVVVPIVAPVLLGLGADPIWLAILMAVNLQTSFLTPPFGFSLFYLRGVAPDSVKTQDIYRGAYPYIAIQLLMLVIIAAFPKMVTFLPQWLYNTHITTVSEQDRAKMQPVLAGGANEKPSWLIDF